MSPIFRVIPLTVGLCLAACDRGASPQASAADSLLARDLTLAAAPAPRVDAPLLGDTASSAAPSAVVPPLSPTMPGPALPQAPTTTRTSPPPPAPNPTVTPPAAAVSTGGAVSSDPAVATAGSAVAGSAVAGSGAGVAGSGTVPRGEIAFGTVLAGRTTGTICAKANRPGDRLVITTTADAFGTNGVRLPAGSQIVVEMTQPEAGSEFSFRAISVQVDTALHPLYGTVRTEAAPTTDRRTSTGDDKGSVLGGAIRGAILGRILGGNRGTIIGAAGGAAAGTIAARRNSVTEHCLPSGIALSVILSAPLALGPGTL